MKLASSGSESPPKRKKMDDDEFFRAVSEESRPRPATYSIRSSSQGSGGSSAEESGSASSSPMSTTSLVDFPVLDKPSTPSLKLELASIEMGLTATTSRESLLDELLGDIRRSCGTSIASTPTGMASLSDGEAESNVFDCRLRRSEAELKTLGISELKRISETLQSEVDCVSSLLVRLLHVKDKRATRASRQCDRLSAILKDYASKNDLCTDLSFSLHLPPCPTSHQPWLNAWRVLSHLPRGIPKMWRRALWSGLTSIPSSSSSSSSSSSHANLDWSSIFHRVFSEYALPGDETLGMQIVKDLHRTGDTGFTSEEEHAVLKRVLLAYARFNKSTGYCQGFNILAALILKVVDFNEREALRVMVHLVDNVLPENYFAQNLYALSVDMAVFRELLKHILPELSQHIDTLQKAASGTIKKSYSSESPPDVQSVHAYEPPLADVFTMQWFLTMFASALPRKATRRVWDLIFLDGSEVLLYTGVAIMAVMERDLLQASTAADFYATMARLGERLRKSQLLPSAEFIQIIYTIQECITNPSSTIPPIRSLREKYAYNVCPCADPDDDEVADSKRRGKRPCPKPSRGGAFNIDDTSGSPGNSPLGKGLTVRNRAKLKEAQFVDGQRNPSPPNEQLGANSIKEQIKLLKQHYNSTARQPATVRCNINLAPPQARVTCPQTRFGVVDGTMLGGSPLQSMAYGPDVPEHVLAKSKMLSGQETLEKLTQQRKKAFTIAYSDDYLGDNVRHGMEVGLESAKWGDFKGVSGILSNMSGPRGRVYVTDRDHMLKAQRS